MLETPVYPEVMPNITQSYGFPVREDILTTNHKGKPVTFFKTSQNVLTAVAPILRRVLEQDEVVYYATSAQDPLPLILADAYTRISFIVTLVFTDRRLLVFNMTNGKANAGWRGNIQSLRWTEVTEFKGAGFAFGGNARFNLQGGAKPLCFTTRAIPKLKTFLPALIERARSQGVRNEGCLSLCARCLKPLAAGVYTCANCGLVYKDESSLTKKLLLPGGPYFYAGMTTVGVVTAISQVIVLLLLLALVLLGGEADTLVTIFILAAAAIYAQVLAWFTARKMIRKHLPADMKQINMESTGISSAPITPR
ncbi:MAG: hypothetical protein FWD64_00900 [Acidobacteriaceae bacterium]|nr:hypothetical protein [Acidobacteriaceae bacterium]